MDVEIKWRTGTGILPLIRIHAVTRVYCVIHDPRMESINARINSWIIGLGAALTPRHDTNNTETILLEPKHQWPTRVPLARVLSTLFVARTEHIVGDPIFAVSALLALLVAPHGHLDL